ncbi:cyclic nucleotide-binding protein [Salinisphaera sp. PC39]|uniref:Crp/Fnr family transcriptional regulator n=1 Tax=Salinisphaera sp. PC39 TaxID=1304156 RepID=UPI00333FE6F6
MAEKSIEQVISEHPFFAGLSDRSLEFLAACATERELAEDEVLFRYGASADAFYLVLSGRITVEVSAIQGPPLELQNLGPDAILGWSWLIPPYTWHFQARAEEPAELLVFDGDAVLRHCENDPAFGYDLFKRFSGLMSERLAAAREKMMNEWSPPGFA